MAGNSKSCQDDVQDDKHSDDERYLQTAPHTFSAVSCVSCLCLFSDHYLVDKSRAFSLVTEATWVRNQNPRIAGHWKIVNTFMLVVFFLCVP